MQPFIDVGLPGAFGATGCGTLPTHQNFGKEGYTARVFQAHVGSLMASMATKMTLAS